MRNPLGAGSNAFGFVGSNQFGLPGTNMNQLGLGGTNMSDATNAFGSTDQPGPGNDTNGYGTNAYGTNGLTPTSNPGMTNRVYRTNSFSFTNQVTVRLEDRAVTPADRGLLIEIRHRCEPVLGQGQPWAPAVHFLCRDKDVIIFGFVPDQDDGQQLVGMVRQTPGVGRVINELVSDDRAFSDADHQLLARLRTQVQPVLAQQPPPPGVVRFVCHGGAVTVVGYVPKLEEKDRILTVVEQTQGVVQVVDQLSLTRQSGPEGRVTPTSRANAPARVYGTNQPGVRGQ